MGIQHAFNHGLHAGVTASATKLAAAYGIDKTALLDDIRGAMGMGKPEEPAVSGTDIGMGLGAAGAGAAGYGADALGRGVDTAAGKIQGLDQQITATGKDFNATRAQQEAMLSEATQQRRRMQGLESGKIVPDVTSKQKLMQQQLDRIVAGDTTGIAKNVVRDNIAMHPDVSRSGNRSVRATELLKRMMSQEAQGAAKSEAEQLRSLIQKNAPARDAAVGRTNDLSKQLSGLGDDYTAAKGSRMGRLSGRISGDTLRNIGGGLKGLGLAGGVGLLGKKLYDVATD